MLAVVVLTSALMPFPQINGHNGGLPIDAGHAKVSSIISDSKNVTFRNVTELSGDVYASNVLISPTATVYSDGYDFLVSGSFLNLGHIVTGYAPFGNLPHSFGGSGGGALDPLNTAHDGFSTISPGGLASFSNFQNASRGITPAPPKPTALLIRAWVQGGTNNYLAGAAGGSTSIMPGAGGANGIYIQAAYLHAGNISSDGMNASFYVPFPWYFYQYPVDGDGGPGGGGGGTILLAYGPGGYTPGNYSYAGGYGGFNEGQYWSSSGALLSYNTAGGGGGNGSILTFDYGNLPPINVAAYSHSIYRSSTPSIFVGAHISYRVTSTYGSSVTQAETYTISLDGYNSSTGVMNMRLPGPNTQYQSLYQPNNFPFLNPDQFHLLAQGKTPSGTLAPAGTSKSNVGVATAYGEVKTYEIVSTGSRVWFSEYSGVLVAAEFLWGGYTYTITVTSTNIPLSSSPFQLSYPDTVIVVIATMVILSILAIAVAEKSIPPAPPEIKRLKSDNESKEQLLAAMQKEGLIDETDFQEYTAKLKNKGL